MKNVVYAAALLAVSSTVYANEALIELDLDQDGAISQEEAANVEGMSAAFETLDANADGKLDEAEFAMFEVAPAVEAEAGLVETLKEEAGAAVEAATDAVTQ